MKKSRAKGFRPSARLGGYLSIALPILVIPLAGNHPKIRAGNGSHVGNHVVATVDIGKSLVEGYIEHLKLVVVAKETLQECLVAEGQLSKVVVGAVHEDKLRAVRYFEGSKIVIGAYEVEESVALAHAERFHVVVGADESGKGGKIRHDHV